MARARKSKSTGRIVKDAIAKINQLKAEEDEEHLEVRGGFKIKVGQYIFETFFDSDIEKAKSKHSKKPASFRKLCESDKIEFSRSWLNDAVRLAIREVELGKDEAYGQLGMSLKTILLRVTDDEKVKALAKQAVDKHLSARALSDLVGRDATPKKNLPPTPKRMMARVEKIGELLDIDDIHEAFPQDRMDKLSDEDVAEMRGKAEALIKQLPRATASVVKELRKVVKILGSKAA